MVTNLCALVTRGEGGKSLGPFEVILGQGAATVSGSHRERLGRLHGQQIRGKTDSVLFPRIKGEG